MYVKNKIILLFFLFITPCLKAIDPVDDSHQNEQPSQSQHESLLKAFGKSVLGYSLGLYTTAAILTVFATARKDIKDHTDLYIASAFVSAFAGGCAANCASNRYPKQTLLGIGSVSLVTLFLIVAAYNSK